jgi:hypothetical protein
MAIRAATPWGPATRVDEVKISQRAGQKRFTTIVELLEDVLSRFASARGGAPRRGPVTLRSRDVQRLRAALDEHPKLAGALGCGGGA